MPVDKYIRYSRQDGFSMPAENGIITPVPGDFESCWHFAGDVATGKMRKLKIRPGFNLWIVDCFFDQNTIVFSDDISPSLSFSFYLAGASRPTVGSSKNTLDLKGGQQGLFYSPESDGSNLMESGTRLRSVGIELGPDWSFPYFEDDTHHLPAVLRKVMAQKYDDVFFHIENITPATQIALHQIVNCPYRGITRKLFFESRALELIGYQMNQISETGPAGITPHIMHPCDREHTEFAKNILVRDMDNPPSLKALARAAGMSHPKLNHCFRRMYGMTAFQYLREVRLNRAREMLENQGLNVTETAYAVGYDSSSHFSQAYKKYFGISPGVYFKTI